MAKSVYNRTIRSSRGDSVVEIIVVHRDASYLLSIVACKRWDYLGREDLPPAQEFKLENISISRSDQQKIDALFSQFMPCVVQIDTDIGVIGFNLFKTTDKAIVDVGKLALEVGIVGPTQFQASLVTVVDPTSFGIGYA